MTTFPSGIEVCGVCSIVGDGNGCPCWSPITRNLSYKGKCSICNHTPDMDTLPLPTNESLCSCWIERTIDNLNQDINKSYSQGPYIRVEYHQKLAIETWDEFAVRMRDYIEIQGGHALTAHIERNYHGPERIIYTMKEQ